MNSEKTDPFPAAALALPRTETAPPVVQLEHDAAATSARSTLQLLAGRACFMLSGYLITVVLARNLGPAEYGVYGVVVSVLLWIEMTASAGIPGATAKLIPQYGNESSPVEHTAMMLLLGISLVLFLVGWLVAPAFARLFDIQTGTTLFRLAILDIPLNGMYLAYQGILHGHRRFGTLSIGLILYGLTKVIGILALWSMGLSVSGALIVNVLATSGVLIYLMIKFPPKVPLRRPALMKSIMRVALPMGFYLIALQLLLSFDLWSLKSLWRGKQDVIGVYVAALNVAKLTMVVPSVVSGVLFASLSWALAQKRELLAQQYIQEIARLALIVLVPSCVLIALHGESVMVFLYSSAYASGGVYLGLQLIAYGLLPFFDVFCHALMAADRRRTSAVIPLVLLPLVAVCNLLFIPSLGAVAAAASLAAVVCLGTVISAVLAYQRFGSLIRLSTVTRVAVATGLMSLVSTQFSVTSPWLLLKMFALLGVYTLCLILLSEVGRKDWEAVWLWEKGA